MRRPADRLAVLVTGEDERTACDMAYVAGLAVRVVERDGVGRAVTADVDPRRISLWVVSGVVVAAAVG